MQKSAKAKYRSPFDAFRYIYAKHGATGIFRGSSQTFLRQSIGFMVYFPLYEYLKSLRSPIAPDGSRPSVPVWYTLGAGGICGVAIWIVSYPFDTMKSILQADSLAKPKFKNVRTVA